MARNSFWRDLLYDGEKAITHFAMMKKNGEVLFKLAKLIL